MKAFHYYKKSADDYDDDVSSFRMGWMYENGVGIQKGDIHTAIEYYKKSSKFNNLESLIRLSSIYELGKGVEKDLDKALYYCWRASKGDEDYKNHYRMLWEQKKIQENSQNLNTFQN